MAKASQRATMKALQEWYQSPEFRLMKKRAEMLDRAVDAWMAAVKKRQKVKRARNGKG